MTMTCQPTQAAQPWITISSKIAGFLKIRQWFIKNRSVKFKIFKILGHFELKNSTKTRVYFKNFGQNQIQKFKVMHPIKFIEV
jgi:hypothetical protein